MPDDVRPTLAVIIGTTFRPNLTSPHNLFYFRPQQHLEPLKRPSLLDGRKGAAIATFASPHATAAPYNAPSGPPAPSPASSSSSPPPPGGRGCRRSEGRVTEGGSGRITGRRKIAASFHRRSSQQRNRQQPQQQFQQRKSFHCSKYGG